MGIYIVDYINGLSGTLVENGNHATNVIYTYNAEVGRWSTNTPAYWRDQQTAIDVYGYYPFDNSMSSVSEHLFSVERDQSREGTSGDMGGYEKSDFLWAKKENVQPTSNTIFLNYEHRLAGIKVILQQGEGFTGDEWKKVKRIVTIEGTQLSAKIDLATGIATPNGSVGQIIAAPQGEETWRAVCIPQIVESGKPLIGVTIDGTSYKYTREETTKLTQGKMHTFTLRIDKKEGGTYTASIVAESIEAWENDNSSHNFEAAAYTIIDCPREGTLENCVRKSGKNAGEIINLKITGRMNADDFAYLRHNMFFLQSLNLYDVVSIGSIATFNIIYHSSTEETEDVYLKKYFECNKPMENVLPTSALGKFYVGSNPENKMNYLKHLVLPKSLKVLGYNSLSGVNLAENTTLVIPKTVTCLQAFSLAGIVHGNIVLPDSLVFVGYRAMSENNCRFEYNLGNTVKYIGKEAFRFTNNCTGHFSLPSGLEHLGYDAFNGCGNQLTGDIVIPEKITEVNAFRSMQFANGTKLIMHDGVTSITSIGGLTINNYIVWPKNLRTLANSVYNRWNNENVTFRGGMAPLPASLRAIGSFKYSSYMPEHFVIPDKVESIQKFTYCDMKSVELGENTMTIMSGDHEFDGAFSFCKNLESVTIKKNMETIGDWAFAYCDALKLIRCHATTPPTLGQNVFEGCDLEHLVLEVPAKSVNKYRSSPGWSEIKYITAYHELATGISNITCLDKGITREMVVRSEGAWKIKSCPSWVHLSETSSGVRTTELTVKVDASSVERQGEIVFCLKDKDYTTTCNVHQYIAEEQEDKEIVLQEASAGATPIPVFIVGDGFTAEEIANGTYLEKVRNYAEHFFAIEPFKTYRNYFTVSTALACSAEKGICNAVKPVKNRFSTTYDPGGTKYGENGYGCDYESLMRYAINTARGISYDNIANVLIMVIMNQDNFAGDVWIDEFGTTIAFATDSHDSYPYDTRGLVQHYAGGRGFGRLAPEFVEHFDFLKACSCPYCNGITRYNAGRTNGWYGNVSLDGGMTSVPWSHLIFDSRYSDIVDVFEGAYRHARGAFRSENMSCMSNYIQYFNTYSRELIVRRIMELAGKKFDFEEFVRKDSREGLPEH